MPLRGSKSNHLDDFGRMQLQKAKKFIEILGFLYYECWELLKCGDIMFEFSGLAGFSVKNVISRHGQTGDLTGSTSKMDLVWVYLILFVKSFATMECRCLLVQGSCICFDFSFAWGHRSRKFFLSLMFLKKKCNRRSCDVQSFGVGMVGPLQPIGSISSFDCYPSLQVDAKSSFKNSPKVSL